MMCGHLQPGVSAGSDLNYFIAGSWKTQICSHWSFNLIYFNMLGWGAGLVKKCLLCK